MSIHRMRTCLSLLVLLALPCGHGFAQVPDADAMPHLEAEVERIFARSCARAGCHAGPVPQEGLDLSAARFVETLVAIPSRQRPEFLRVHPGRPDSSYILMKLRGDPRIDGVQMPMIGDRLTEEEIGTIAAWIGGLTEDAAARAATSHEAARYPFHGWKAMNLPTSRTLDAGSWLFLISHRFNPRIQDGYEAFFGLDGSGIIYLSMGYAVTDALLVAVGRSDADDNVELQVRQRLTRQSVRMPIDAAVQVGLNWITAPHPGLASGNRFKTHVQLSLTHAIGHDAGVAVVPGVLLNPNHLEEDEGPLLTFGLAGRWRVWRKVALVGEWVPIVSGYTPSTIFGNANRFDSLGGGIEISTGGHVFQIVGSNSVGLTTDQYMSGGDLDIRSGDVRLGFNIFRILNF